MTGAAAADTPGPGTVPSAQHGPEPRTAPQLTPQDCELCRRDVEELALQAESSQEQPETAEEIAGTMGIAMYWLGRLHEQGHPKTLLEYGQSILKETETEAEHNT